VNIYIFYFVLEKYIWKLLLFLVSSLPKFKALLFLNEYNKLVNFCASRFYQKEKEEKGKLKKMVYIKVCEIKLHKGHFSIAQTLLQDIIQESSYKRERDRDREERETLCLYSVFLCVD
jgi:hypothetical protein